LAAENETDDQTREYLSQIVRRLRITLEAEKLACQTHHRWQPPADLDDIDQFSGRLMDERPVIDYGDPKPKRAAAPAPPYQVAYIKQRPYILRGPNGMSGDSAHIELNTRLRYHAIKPGQRQSEKRAVCGVNRLGGIQVASAYDRRLPLRMLPESMNTTREQIERRVPKHWVTADVGTEANCPSCLARLRREQPSTRPKPRRRPGF
jgi:hypothetical protein